MAAQVDKATTRYVMPCSTQCGQLTRTQSWNPERS